MFNAGAGLIGSSVERLIAVRRTFRLAAAPAIWSAGITIFCAGELDPSG